MTVAALQGRTEWEADEYARDHGRTAAQAIGWQLLARHVNACAHGDMDILGLREIPDPRPQSWPVTAGTSAERKARVDAWAERYGIKAHTDEASGQYKAVLTFGPVRLEAYTIPDLVVAARLEAIHRAVAERGVA